MEDDKHETKKNFTVRYLTTDDLEQYDTLLRYSFQVTEQDLFDTGWRSDEMQQSKFPVLERADVLGCFDGDYLVSQVAVYPLRANIYGVFYPIGFVTSVCTYPEYTGNGIMKRLMYQSLVHMRERRQPFAMLFPYSIPLYRKLGWEIISDKITYTVKDRQMPSNAEAPGFVRRVDWDNEDFMRLHERFASVTHGCLFRNSLAWEEYWRWDKDDTVVAIYYDVQNTPSGYMVYLIKDDIMYIKEMIYLNREAQEGLWEYIRAHDSMIDEGHGNSYYNEPIAFDMDDGDIREMIRPYIMGRIVDVEQFLLLYRCDPREKGVCFALEITDSFLPWNNRTVSVRFEKGRCSLTEETAQYRVGLSISTLSTLLLGYKTAAKLYRLGRIDADEAGLPAHDFRTGIRPSVPRYKQEAARPQSDARLLLFMSGLLFAQVYLLQPHPQLQSPAFGGKNSSVGKSILRKSSQGLSLEVTHSFSGTQKSNAGISICTLRTICTIVKRPIVTYTVFFCGAVSNAPP